MVALLVAGVAAFGVAALVLLVSLLTTPRAARVGRR